MSLIDSLDHILEWHKRNDTPVARLIQPGLSEDEILSQFGAVSFKLSAELRELYRWHDDPNMSEEDMRKRLGNPVPFRLSREFIELYKWRNGVPLEEGQPDSSFFEYHRFLPLDEALSNFKISYPIMKEFYELTDWVQVFQDPAADGYGLAGGPQVMDEAPVVFLFEGEGVQVVFDSLAKMAETVAQAFDEGVMIWEEGELDTDFFAWGEVAHRLNPGIQYWRDYVKGGGPGS